MADNFLEKRQEQYRLDAAKGQHRRPASLMQLLKKNRSCRGYDSSFIVGADRLRRIIAVNTMVPSSRNAQPLRFRPVVGDEAAALLPHVRMGASLPDLHLPQPGFEPNAYIVVCSASAPSPSLYIDLGISVQSMLLQATEMGLNGLCIGSFDADAVTSLLALPMTPLLVVAIGRSAEKHVLVDIAADEEHAYYRKADVHYVPKVRIDDLILPSQDFS